LLSLLLSLLLLKASGECGRRRRRRRRHPSSSVMRVLIMQQAVRGDFDIFCHFIQTLNHISSSAVSLLLSSSFHFYASFTYKSAFYISRDVRRHR
jgi:hypothetical protein